MSFAPTGSEEGHVHDRRLAMLYGEVSVNSLVFPAKTSKGVYEYEATENTEGI